MPSINVGEADFMALVVAAQEAQRAGDAGQAAALDKLARKINAALSSDNPTMRILRRAGRPAAPPARWQDMPSTLDPIST